MSWSFADIPDLTGRTALVTGATSGLGLITARELARAGAHVVLAARTAERLANADERIRTWVPDASLERVPLDLADLASVARVAETLRDRHPQLDLLIANAGVMATPARRTADGTDLQLGVNHLGHAALVVRLLDRLLAARAARVVVISSGAHRLGHIARDDLGDPDWWIPGAGGRYGRWSAYGRSKLANLLFLTELQRRFDAAGAAAIAVGAHPGYARTELQTTGPTQQGGVSGTINRVVNELGNTVVAQSAAAGAVPQLYAATAPEVPGGSYWGPDGPGELRGRTPAPAARSRAARDPELAHALWDATIARAGVDPAPLDAA